MYFIDERDPSAKKEIFQYLGLNEFMSCVLFQHFYSLALTGGRVEGRFAGGGVLPLILNSDEFFNDGVSHNIAVKKTNRK